MKIMVCGIVVLAVTMAGCAVSEKTPSSPTSVGTYNDPAVEATDDDFDLFEEEYEQKAVNVADPLEPVNRVMYHVNDAFYFWLLKPVTQTYTHIAPEPVRIGIGNFFGNLTTPIRFVNCHLQGKKAVADIELKRFWVNTTAGVLGFGDPAKDRHDLPPPSREDLGQTMATYGVGDGFYLVLPIFGPSTLRDTVGRVGDMFLNPAFYVEPTEAAIGISATRVTNETSFRIGEYEAFKADALDPYVAMRNVYIQYRTQKIKE